MWAMRRDAEALIRAIGEDRERHRPAEIEWAERHVGRLLRDVLEEQPRRLRRIGAFLTASGLALTAFSAAGAYRFPGVPEAPAEAQTPYLLRHFGVFFWIALLSVAAFGVSMIVAGQGLRRLREWARHFVVGLVCAAAILSTGYHLFAVVFMASMPGDPSWSFAAAALVYVALQLFFLWILKDYFTSDIVREACR